MNPLTLTPARRRLGVRALLRRFWLARVGQSPLPVRLGRPRQKRRSTGAVQNLADA
jgi:hypothetical protein